MPKQKKKKVRRVLLYFRREGQKEDRLQDSEKGRAFKRPRSRREKEVVRRQEG